jgi:hypothetical protein
MAINLTGNKEASWVQVVYTHFFGRDLTYLMAGGGACFLFACAWTRDLPKQLPDTAFAGICLAALAYVIGLSLSECTRALGLKEPSVDPGRQQTLFKHSWSRLTFFMFGHGKTALDKLFSYHRFDYWSTVLGNVDDRLLTMTERTVFLMHMGASIGASAVFGAASLLLGAMFNLGTSSHPLDRNYWIGLLVALGFGIGMLRYSAIMRDEVSAEWIVLSQIAAKKRGESLQTHSGLPEVEVPSDASLADGAWPEHR